MLVVAIATLVAEGTAGANPQPTVSRAEATRTLVADDESHLKEKKESGRNVLEEGPATGTLPGWVSAKFSIGATIKASFVIYPRGGGSISGEGEGALHSTKQFASFGGHMKITSGTGRYRYVHGSGGFYGVVNRETFAITAQTRGALHY